MTYKKERARISRLLREDVFKHEYNIKTFSGEIVEIYFEIEEKNKDKIVWFGAEYKDEIINGYCECSIPMTKIADLILENAENIVKEYNGGTTK